MQPSCYNRAMSRAPKTKNAIFALLRHDHILSAVEIQEQLEKKGLVLNKTTIYRALEKMLTEGRLCRHSFGRDKLLYELRDHHHDHAVCESCGKVMVLKCGETIEKQLHQPDFKPSHHHLTVFGTCANCSKITHDGQLLQK